MKYIAWLILLTWLPLTQAEESVITFDVYLDDSPIGFHRVNVERLEQEKRVRVEADMKVDFLFFTAFSYQHEANERWQEGCIVQLDTSTNDDGEKLKVSGTRTENGLEVVTQSDRKLIDGCVHTFAYWDVNLLSSASHLLNTQNGSYEPARLTMQDAQPLQFKGEAFGSKRYRLEVGEGVAINLWYSDDYQWQALETEVAGGRKLRYLRRQS